MFMVIVMTNQTVNIFRSTVVHSNAISAKDPHITTALKDRQIAEESCSRSSRETDGMPGNLSRTLQASQRIPMGTLSMLTANCSFRTFFSSESICHFSLFIKKWGMFLSGFIYVYIFIRLKLNLFGCSAKPGKVVGPLGPPSENGSAIKDAYDHHRTLIRNAVLPPQALPPAYCYRRTSAGKLERCVGEAERDLPAAAAQAKQVPQCGMAAKLTPDIAINIDSNPFYMTRAGVTKVDHLVVDDRISIDANLLQAKSQFGGIGAAAAAAAAAAHRKVGTVQFGMSRMY